MKSCVPVLLIAALVAVICGCPQTTTKPVETATKLLDKYKTEGEAPNVTILMFTTGRADAKVQRIKRELEGVERLSDGQIKFMEVSRDREGRDAYAVRGFPTILFFGKEGNLKRREGLRLNMEIAKQIVTELGVTLRSTEEEEERGEEGGTGE